VTKGHLLIASVVIGAVVACLTLAHLRRHPRDLWAWLGTALGTTAACGYFCLTFCLLVAAVGETLHVLADRSYGGGSSSAVILWVGFIGSILIVRWLGDPPPRELSIKTKSVRPVQLSPPDDAGWEEIRPPEAPRLARGRDWD
jgi:hypothetical protein